MGKGEQRVFFFFILVVSSYLEGMPNFFAKTHRKLIRKALQKLLTSRSADGWMLPLPPPSQATVAIAGDWMEHLL